MILISSAYSSGFDTKQERALNLGEGNRARCTPWIGQPYGRRYLRSPTCPGNNNFDFIFIVNRHNKGVVSANVRHLIYNVELGAGKVEVSVYLFLFCVAFWWYTSIHK